MKIHVAQEDIKIISFTHINEAQDLAAYIHGNQYRKGRPGEIGPNYLVHPAAVVHQLWKWGFHPGKHAELFCLAWLHDVIEESSTSFLGDIRNIHPDLETWVKELTFLPGQDFCPYQTKKEYVASFLDPAKTNVRSLIVKAADRLCNIRDFIESDYFAEPGKEYACKYWEKGKPIFDAVWKDRREEVKEFLEDNKSWFMIIHGDIFRIESKIHSEYHPVQT